MWNNRIKDLYYDTNATTTLEIEGATYEVTYNQELNQFEVITMQLILDKYPEEEKMDIELLFDIAEDMLQEQHERNFDYGNEFK
tara:strand:- start:118 stop:369 length:252 start_codon:yes stop_codon:yes gene_type:complete